MNTGVKISRGLTFVNIAGMLVIVWLAASFFFKAEQQRRDANWFLQNIKVQEVLYKADAALLREQFELSYLNSEFSGSGGQNSNTLNVLFSETDKQLDLAIANLAAVLAEKQFLYRVSLSYKSLNENLENLREYRDHLHTYRSQAQKESSSQFYGSETSSFLNLHSKYNRISRLLNYLGSGLQYFPAYSVAKTPRYLNLLNDLWLSYQDLMLDATAVAVSVSENVAIDVGQQLILDANEASFERGWSPVLQSAASNRIDEEVTGKVSFANRFYRETYIQQKIQVLSSGALADTESTPLESWKLTVSNLSGQLADIQTSGYKSQKSLALDSLQQTKRNFLVDAVTILVFVGVAGLWFLISQRIKRQALHDGLTNLPNRTYLESKLLKLKQSNKSPDSSSAMIYLDLDRFKMINDNYGHDFGDKLLKSVASRLVDVCEPDDFISRVGGDEFAILRSGCRSRESVMEFAASLVDVLDEEHIIDGTQVTAAVSSGVCIAPQDCTAGPALMKCSDIAMYQAKVTGRSRVGSYSAEMAENYKERIVLEQALRQGVAKNQFSLSYQPKVSCDAGVVVGVEALLRWQHPQLGNVSPAKFVPVAEEANLMGPIGKWVIRKAFEDIAGFNRQHSTNLHVAVNISAQQFTDMTFLAELNEVLEASGLSSEQVELELTESMVMTDVEAVNAKLSELKNTGIKVAVDDFGTGYSSLQYLQELSLDVLKIDRAFVVALDRVDPKNSVANSIVQLARIMDLKTVAEGVETNEQCVKVRSLGVDMIQGYLYSKPVPIDELYEHLVNIRNQLNPDAGYKAVA